VIEVIGPRSFDERDRARLERRACSSAAPRSSPSSTPGSIARSRPIAGCAC